MADNETILETRSLVKEFKGFVAWSDGESQGQARQNPCTDWPERRRQTTFFNLLTKF